MNHNIDSPHLNKSHDHNRTTGPEMKSNKSRIGSQRVITPPHTHTLTFLSPPPSPLYKDAPGTRSWPLEALWLRPRVISAASASSSAWMVSLPPPSAAELRGAPSPARDWDSSLWVVVSWVSSSVSSPRMASKLTSWSAKTENVEKSSSLCNCLQLYTPSVLGLQSQKTPITVLSL